MAAQKDYKMVRCIDCKHGSYMQWMQNPIICECECLNERFVAESRKVCQLYEARSKQGAPQIAHYEHY